MAVEVLAHTTRAAGTLLLSSIYNEDHLKHVTNALALDVGLDQVNVRVDELDDIKTDAQASADAAATSATAAAASEADAETSATEASQAADTAGARAVEAGDSASEANVAANAALNSETKAQLWAEETEDVEVEPGAFSAKHWAGKSAGLAAIDAVATQAQAEAGVANDKAMTPLRSRQHGDGRYVRPILADITVNVPSDYATLQEAIDDLSQRPVRNGAKIFINIESGHSPTSGIIVSHGNYGHFGIISTDAEVTLGAGWPDSEIVLYGENARLPVLSCLIDANSKGRVGIWANNGSTVYVPGGAGIKNMGNAASGLTYAGTALRIAHGSRAAIGGTIFSGAKLHGIQATQGVTIHASTADFSNAAGYALFLSRGAIFHGHDMNLSGAGEVAVRAGRSYASVRGSNCQNAGNYGIWAFEGSIVAARAANLSGAGIDGVHAFQGGAWVDVNLATINNCIGSGIVGRDGSTINAVGATIQDNGGSAIDVSFGCNLAARSAVIRGKVGSSPNTVWIADGSRADLTDAVITGSPGNGLRVEDGAHATLTGASITGSAADDISVNRGAIAAANNVTTSSSGTSGNSPDINDVNVPMFNTVSNPFASMILSAGAANLGGWQVVAASAVPASHTGNLNSTTLATITLPAGFMGKNGVARITTYWSASGDTQAKQAQVYFGGTQIQRVNISGSEVALQMLRMIRNRDSFSSQIMAGLQEPIPYREHTVAPLTTTKDTSADVTIELRGQLFTTASNVITLEAYMVEVFYQA